MSLAHFLSLSAFSCSMLHDGQCFEVHPVIQVCHLRGYPWIVVFWRAIGNGDTDAFQADVISCLAEISYRQLLSIWLCCCALWRQGSLWHLWSCWETSQHRCVIFFQSRMHIARRHPYSPWSRSCWNRRKEHWQLVSCLRMLSMTMVILGDGIYPPEIGLPPSASIYSDLLEQRWDCVLAER